MRFSPVALSVGLLVATMASSGQGQRPDDQVNPQSVALLRAGEARLAAADYPGATDLLETALAVDPRNRAAYSVLGRVALAQKLPGKAIRFYNEALGLEPNDAVALAGQGEAFVARGAVARAQANLTKVRALCKGACPEATRLSAAIAKGPPPAAVTAATPAPATSPAPVRQ